MRSKELADIEGGWDLLHRLNRLTCFALGHKKSGWLAFVFLHGSKAGQQFAWLPCKRCSMVLEGDRPSSLEMMSDQLITIYPPELFGVNSPMVGLLEEEDGNE